MRTLAPSIIVVAVLTLAFTTSLLDAGVSMSSARYSRYTGYESDQLGSVTGTLQWPIDAVRTSYLLPSAPNMRQPLNDTMASSIEMHVYAGRYGRPVGSAPIFSNLVIDGNTVWLTYTINDVPMDVPLVVSGRQKHGGTFGPIYPGAITPSDPVAVNCDMGLLQRF